MSDFINLVIRHVVDLRLEFPLTSYHQKYRERTRYNTLHELLPLGQIQYGYNDLVMQQTLQPPLLLSSNIESHLTPVFQHYLRFIPSCDTRSHTNCFGITIDDNQYWLSFIEKSLLCVVVCFIEPYFECVGTGLVAMPGQLRNFLSTCNVTSNKARCGWMSRFTEGESHRQSIFISLLNYDDFTYRKRHRPSSLHPIDNADRTTRIRHVLLYFLTMCHETLSDMKIPIQSRFAHLRCMLDNYLDGDQVGLANTQLPRYYQGENTIVHKLLERNAALRMEHSRILHRTTVINKYLYTGQARYHNERHSRYAIDVVPVIPKLPVHTRLLDGLPYESKIKRYAVDYINGVHLIGVLTAKCELKLLSEIESHITQRDLLPHYVFGFVSHQVAIRLQRYVAECSAVLGEMNFWVADMSHPQTDEMHTLVILPKPLHLHMMVTSMLLYARQNPQHALSIAPLLCSQIRFPPSNVNKDEHDSTQLSDVIWLLSVMLLEKPLQVTDKLRKHATATSRLLYHLYHHQYQHPTKQSMHKVIDYYARIKRTPDRVSTFGHLGSVLLAWFIAPFTQVWITKTNFDVLADFAEGKRLKEIEADLFNAPKTSAQLANDLRRQVTFQRFFATDETPDPQEYQMLSSSDVFKLQKQVENFIQPESLYIGYHPDVIFALLSMLCPVVSLTRAQFDHLFPFANESIKQQPVESHFEPQSRWFTDRHTHDPQSFQHESQLSSWMACFAIGGLLHQDERRAEFSALLQKPRLHLPELWFNDEDWLLLPEFVHPGEIIDPWAMSLLMQTEEREQKTGQTRYRNDCPLFRHAVKRSPEYLPFSPPRNSSMMDIRVNFESDSDESMGEKQPAVKRSRSMRDYPEPPDTEITENGSIDNLL